MTGDMTELLYQTDAALREFEGKVLASRQQPASVVLDRTAFYPGGGGQPADRGWLTFVGDRCPVVGLEREQGQLWHLIQGALPPVGGTVLGELDWEHRYACMRTHTAMHILCGVVWRDFGAMVTGGNMEPLHARMDFEFEALSGELVRMIEERVNLEVEACREVRVAMHPREQAMAIPDLIRTKINLLPAHVTEVRTVEIVGLDLQADGGTHVANTREVGHMRIPRYQSKGRINKRIYVELDA
mgnify:CR=1 FL=1